MIGITSDYNVLLLSDIHLHADYNGQFDTVGNFEKTVARASELLPGGYDAIILAGDIVEDTYEGDDGYRFVFEKCRTIAKKGCGNNILATPGNHDDRAKMTEAYKHTFGGSPEYWDFSTPGENCPIVSLGGKTVVLMDSGNTFPHAGLAKLGRFAYTFRDTYRRNDTLVFTHKPFKCPGRLYHRFMNNNMLEEAMLQMVQPFAEHYFCGHLHHATAFTAGDVEVTINPGVQCQIDPYAMNCAPTPLSGFAVVSWQRANNSAIHTYTEFVEVDK